nr:immunoglobulin light chain junction region [Macaca mulatta]MOX34684.1 immunoglobulin light chain junction region [Macaca mulatta]MOX34903.1 immunoglobulin light chain junction region [Macaca mulatta]MOX34914.1 immunoglobulin light chain junction region [Macaca mulatta]MOX35373.1 immunoglobulin light chain junction region [Macaca mulatta]
DYYCSSYASTYTIF